jgi:type IV pilus assembly protein PilN
MIKINLLTAERKAVKKRALFLAGQKLTIGCSLILVATGLGIGWRYFALEKESRALDQEISDAQKETTRLHSIIMQVQQYEQQKAQLQQRVNLIEQLRNEQKGPVHMLDQISRALPPMLWLTGLKQGATTNEVLIDGEGPSQSSVSDFVASLEATGYFKKSVDIVSSATEAIKGPPGELVKFSLKAEFEQPAPPKPPAAAGAVKAPPKASN